jgi:carbonic anhydrase
MATMNISRDNVKGKCDLKCSYNFKYSDSTTTAKNNGEMISLTYDNSSTTQVLYNNKKYTVTSIYITSPSIHTFNGSTTDAEICIEHTPISGGPLFSVGIPVKSSSETTTASSLLTEIISAVATSAPTKGNSASLNIDGFSLDKIVPSKPFFSYTSSTDNMQWIVYGIVDAIPLSSSTLAKLGQIITPFPLTMSGDALFYNSTGPNSVSVGEGIYLKCNPTGSSAEEISIDYAKNPTSTGLNDLFSGPVISIILQSIVLIIIIILFFYLIKYIYGRISGGTAGAPVLGKMPWAKA